MEAPPLKPRGISATAECGESSSVTGLSLAGLGVSAAKPPLWSLPTMFVADAGAAASIGLIDSLGTLSGYVGPHTIGASEAGGQPYLVG